MLNFHAYCNISINFHHIFFADTFQAMSYVAESFTAILLLNQQGLSLCGLGKCSIPLAILFQVELMCEIKPDLFVATLFYTT